ncbi:hypothetical protein ACFFF5_14765 [Lederbergia wuyishanensis]|uniref:Yip1 domain-containing protein n=1 Tax=Lederbergia wuyishanensis TaxID=1347903 RepID=A0ABU0D386_9BACI|nr:hypothetical protein [Lederbergia wuyishanensis]MCJ8007959.1 hypothetical protein [Lederbergia wuyishanensis]MDQ0342871.1 hypothetical protein [Lederbergia wuyishanensis]
MIYQTNISKGLFFYNRTLFQLQKAESIYGLNIRLFWLFLSSAVVFFISGLFGIGSHVISPELARSSNVQYEAVKSYFVIGRLLLGLLYAFVIIYLPALFYWTFSDTFYKKFVVIQVISLPILLVEQITYIILAVFFNLPWYSSPLSFGVIAQYITKSDFVIYLCGAISFLKIWAAVVQYKGVRTLISLSSVKSVLLVIIINLFFWSLTAVFAYINFKTIL